LAKSGKIKSELLYELNDLGFYKQSSPKSLGREWVEKNVFPVLKNYNLPNNDLLSTFTEHIALQIAEVLNNGNDFAEKALENGALCSIVDDERFLKNENCIVVEDTLVALQELAKLYRQSLQATFIGITGSNGKTTTKELIREVLSSKYKTQATIGNLNNHLGVPLTILALPSDIKYAVIEMGANHIGEIKELCEIIQPDYGLITNIGKAHLEGFGGFDGVKKAKSELYKFVKKANGEIFINNDNDVLKSLAKDLSKISYGKGKEVFCQGDIISSHSFVKIMINHRTEISTQLIGAYNFENILAACCIGKYFNVEDENIKQAIESYIPDNNRSQILNTGVNTVIMDAYNANPSSMEAAISNFANSHYENKVLILGEMLELGIDSNLEHSKIVKIALDGGFERVYLSGDEYVNLPENNILQHFINTDLLCLYLEKNKIESKTILVKGSRGNRLEKIQQYL